MTNETSSKPGTKRARKMAREPGPDDKQRKQEVGSGAAPVEPMPPKAPSKTSTILGMLQHEGGTTLEEMVRATGWLPHTTRAALTGIRKKGHEVVRSKFDGETRYAIVAAPAQ